MNRLTVHVVLVRRTRRSTTNLRALLAGVGPTAFLLVGMLLSSCSSDGTAGTGGMSGAGGASGSGGAAGTAGIGGVGGTGAPKCVLQTEAAPFGLLQLDVETVADGLEVPWGLAFLPDGNILVTERPGRLLLLRTGEVPALVEEVDVAQVNSQFGFEGGLLGILLHPDFETNRLFYLYYTATKPDDSLVNRIERYELANDALSATSDRIILDDIPAGDYHQGGRMRIGPDGLLYVGVGAFEPALAQDPDSLAGKLLRMNLDGSIPADNPEPSSLVFISGIRNTQGFDWFDENRLLIMDHGPTQQTDGMRGLDELNVAQAGDNLGWPEISGCDVSDGLSPPAMVWEEPFPPGGATLYTGTAIPSWTGSLMVTALGFNAPSGRHLHRLELDPGDPRTVVAQESFLVNTYGRLRTSAMGPDGFLYVTTSNCDGIRSSCPEEGDLVLRVVGTTGP